MKTIFRNNEGFSLMEILMACTLLVVAIAGVFATFTTVRSNTANRENALAATVFGKQVLEALYATVTDTGNYRFYGGCFNATCSGCCDFSLSLGTHNVPTASLPANLAWPGGPGGPMATLNGNQVTYTVSCADNGSTTGPCNQPFTSAHAVTLGIKWNSVP